MKLKITAAVIAALLAQLLLPAVFAGAADAAAPILWYEFDDGAKDSSGNGQNGTVNGAVIKDGSAVFDGTDDYIKMPDGILKNAASATVAIYLKPEIEKANQFTWCIGNSSENGYMFLNTYNPNSKLRAAITKTTYTAEEELASSAYAAKDEWVSIIAVFDGANSALYRDGERVATNTAMTIKPSDLGATTANYIAKSVYNDPYFKGTVSDFRIYDTALSAEEAGKVFEEQKSSYTKTAPEITSVTGSGIKTHGVEIDSQNNTVFLPLLVGTDTSELAPEFACERDADITLTSGTYANGTITVTDKSDAALSKQWTITAAERGNAVLDGFYADPNIACFNGKYYIYPTTDGGSGWDAPYFKCFSSNDLVNWTDEGVILDLKDVSWSNGKNGWAPTITEKNGKYYFYYSAAPFGNGAKNLAVAVSDSPTGPFEDKGVIVGGGSLSGQMIDPAVFTDDDGQSYLYWGNGSMYGAKLSPDMLSVETDTIKKFSPSNFREGSFMIKRGGKYYMMWSADDTGNPNYRVYYGTMDSPLGTITGSTLILQRDNADSKLIKGTGHHSVVNVPGTDEWYICYHRFNTALFGNQESQSSAAGNHREVCIDKMEFDEKGNIKRVIPTLKGITEPVYVKYPIKITKAEIKDGILSYALSSDEDVSDSDVYTALYNSDGTLKAVDKNKTEGMFEIDAQNDYAIKAFVWKKNTMEPVGTSYDKKWIKVDKSLAALADELAPDSEIRGNQYMPSEYNGVSIEWISDNTAVSADGTVKRGDADVNVNIKAVFTKGAETFEKIYKAKVIAAPSNKSEDDMGAYLFVHFVGTEQNADSEQIYFSVSSDGQNWETLNEGAPVLKSTMREGGVRDPHIVRSPEGDKFFLIATDLSIYNRRGDSNRWGTCQTSGSQHIMIWESTDLVNWSEQRAVRIAPSNAGCTWAPESIYDYEKGQYMVFWASKVSDDNYSTQRIYRSYTTDFEHFTDPEVYIDGGNISNIDTTFIYHDNIYYRFTKNESKSSVTMMKSSSLNGGFTDVGTYTLNGTAGNTVTGYEGPTIYKLNGENKWCLLLDYYSKSQGYKPFITNDIAKGVFTSPSDFNFDTKYRHGTVMPITSSEYNALIRAYGGNEPVYTDTKPEPIVKYDFENNALSDINAVFKTGASLVNDTAKNSRVLYLNGASGSYMEFAAPKDGDGSALENYTVSFDVKNNTTGNYFNFYIGDGSSKATATNYLGVKVSDTILVSTVDSSTEKKTNLTVSGVQGSWMHFDIVVSNGIVQVYVNNQPKGELKGYMMKTVKPSVIRFGFSPWSADKASNAYYDNIEVYDCALSQAAITGTVIEPRPAENADNDKLLFAMNFNNKDLTAIKGKATSNGTIKYEKSDDTTYAARLSGSGCYLALANADGTSLLTGKDEITITFHKKADAEKTSWWFFASPNDDKQAYGQEHYLGILDGGEKLTAERYHNSGTRNESAEYSYTQGLWQEVTLVIGNDKSTLYIDGEEVSEKDYNFKLSDMLGSNSVAYIGKANWGSGEWAYGLIDDIAVFDFAPEIDFGDLSNVTGDITLPTAEEETDGYSILWESSDESVVTSSGKVTPPASGKKTASLTATITFGAHKLTKTFDVTIKADDYYDFNLQIQNEKGVDIRQGMYGLFFEDINYSADGGLYAEMIENRSFEALKSDGKGGTAYDGLYGWSVYESGISSSPISLKSEGGLNKNNTHYLTLKAGTSIKNQAYEGVYMEAGKTYKVSAFIKKTASDAENVSVKAGVYKDSELIIESTLSENVTSAWTKYEATITPEKTVRNADFVITAAGSVDIDMISCIPDDAVDGIFRRDLAEKLKAINPGFLRFPGGCIIEGYNLANRYNWKDTVGSVEERKQNWSRWACHTSSGLDGGFRHYNQTYGIGYYEYFLLCEYLNCDAVPVVNVGMACEYQSKETVPVFESDGKYTAEFYQYIQDALDLIEFANGDENTTWGKVRCDMGHPEPFGLEMLGIGNEQWLITGNQWYERYEAFEEEIHKNYPDMKLISTSGPSASGTEFTGAWSWIRNAAKTNDKFTYAVDEHYYMDPSWFLENDGRYDKYDRSVKVFAGEYASKGNTLKNALAEAAFMTGLERNADVVYMASYAPLFARLNYTQWSPDMIWFDDAESYVSPDYYVQSMYSNNSGDYTLKSSATEKKVYQSVSYDKETKDIIIKIVNPYEYTERVKFSLDSSFTVIGEADIETLTGKSNADVNSIENPDNIKPVSSKTAITDGTYYNVPPLSFVAIRVHTA